MTEWIETAVQPPPDLESVLGFKRGRISEYGICWRLERNDGDVWTWNGVSTHEKLTRYCVIPDYWTSLPRPPSIKKQQEKGSE